MYDTRCTLVGSTVMTSSAWNRGKSPRRLR